MQLGMIGLGRMDTNMVRRLLNAGHRPRAIWLMIPAAFVDQALQDEEGHVL